MGEAPRFAPAAGLPLWEKNTRVFPSPKLQRADPDLVPPQNRAGVLKRRCLSRG